MKKKIIHYIIIVASCMSILALGSGCDSKSCGNCLGHGCMNCTEACGGCLEMTCIPVCDACTSCLEGMNEGMDEASSTSTN